MVVKVRISPRVQPTESHIHLIVYILTGIPPGIVSRPEISWSVEPTQTTSNVASTYTLSISGEYPCASNTILNPAQSECTHNPAVGSFSVRNSCLTNAQNIVRFDTRELEGAECGPAVVRVVVRFVRR